MSPKRSLAQRIVPYALVLLPMVGFGLVFLLTYSHTYLMRRDENILFAVLDALQRGRSTANAVFTVGYAPAVLIICQWLAHGATMLLVGRSIALLSGIACALLIAVIARTLVPDMRYVPLLALAMTLSSTLFVQESLYFRFNMPSLAFTLLGIVLLLKIQRPFQLHATSGMLLFAAGCVFGCALQIKSLMLIAVPCIAYLLWWLCADQGRWLPPFRRLALAGLLHAVGWLVPTVAIVAALGSEGLRLGGQLGTQLGVAGHVDLALRLNHSVAVFLDFAQHFTWPLLFCIGAFLVAAQNRAGGSVATSSLIILAFWMSTTAAALFVNFPSWDHYFIYLLPPVAICAGIFLQCVGTVLAQSVEAKRRRIVSLSSASLLAGGCLLIALTGTVGAANAIVGEEPTADIAAIQQQILTHTSHEDVVWSDNLIFTLLSERANDPALLDLSIKRILAGGLQEAQLFALLHAHPPRAVIIYDGLFDPFPRFIACLDAISDVTPISLKNQRIYWLQPERLNNQTCGAQ